MVERSDSELCTSGAHVQRAGEVMKHICSSMASNVDLVKLPDETLQWFVEVEQKFAVGQTGRKAKVTSKGVCRQTGLPVRLSYQAQYRQLSVEVLELACAGSCWFVTSCSGCLCSTSELLFAACINATFPYCCSWAKKSLQLPYLVRASKLHAASCQALCVANKHQSSWWNQGLVLHKWLPLVQSRCIPCLCPQVDRCKQG